MEQIQKKKTSKPYSEALRNKKHRWTKNHPPHSLAKRPRWKSVNRTFREEFYACRDLIADSIGAMRFELRKAVEKYNKFRPHHALKGRTPMECLRINQADAA
jgi:transposase InsO family protein